MKTLILTLWAISFSHFVFAQENSLAIQSYKDAEEAFKNGKYETALSDLDIAETMLKTTNSKIQGLKLKSYKQLALVDSTKNFSAYAAYVAELKGKKSSLSNDAALELNNFSKEKILFLENKKSSLINPIEKITIGQSFSTVQKQLYSSIDFENPKHDNSVLHYSRKNDVAEDKIGLYEILVDKNSDRIVKVTAILKALTIEELGSMNLSNFIKEKFAKFDSKTVLSEVQIVKINKKDYNVAITRAKIDDTTLYFLNLYTPSKVNYKDIKNKSSLYFFTEGYEILKTIKL